VITFKHETELPQLVTNYICNHFSTKMSDYIICTYTA